MQSTVQQSGSRRWKITLLAGIALLLILYSILRSAMMCITTDEAFSYLVYVTKNAFLPPSYDFMTANFHMLNTWGMIICNTIFGSDEWSLRLPNVLAHAAWLFFTARFALKSRSTWNAVAVYILLNVHPYLLDFFSVARGYGISFGFIAGALWYMHCYTERKLTKHLVLSLLFAGFAVWASSVMFHVFSAIAGVLAGVILFTKHDDNSIRHKIIQLIAIAVMSAVMILPIVPIVVQMKEAGALVWGTQSLWGFTLRNLGALVLYDVDGSIVMDKTVSDFGLAAALILIGAIVLAGIFRKSIPPKLPLVAMAAVLMLCFASVILHHFFLDTPYPYTRTGLFLFVVLIFTVAIAVRDNIIGNNIALGICIVVIPLQLWTASSDFNLRHTEEWQFCEDVEIALDEIISDFQPAPEHPATTVACDIEIYNPFRYYLETRNISNVTMAMRIPGSPEPVADYYLLTRSDHSTVPASDTVAKYPDSSLLLLRRIDSVVP